MTRSLTFEELDALAIPYDDAVAEAFALDRFCSSTFWLLPAALNLMPPSSPRIFQEDGTYVVLARSSNWLHPLEAMWCLSCPLVSSAAEAAVELLLRVLELEEGWKAALLTGLVESSPLWRLLVPALSRRFTVAFGPKTRRYVADLAMGVDGFLGRRSRGFRRSLQRAARQGRRRGVVFEIEDEASPEDADRSFDRILAVERRSWKGLRGVGIVDGPMSSFYRDMNRRLLRRRARRLTFARIDGEDVAYILGGVFGDTYRGLQFSFDARFPELSLGNLCQLEEIRRLSGTAIQRYDLGTEVRYKRNWGETVVATASLVVQR